MSKSSTSSDYIQTTTSNYVSRQAELRGAKHVEIKGRSIIDPHVVIAGDKALVKIGRYTHIQSSTTITPSGRPNAASYIPVTIGSHTTIGSGCSIAAASIGSNCWIGNKVTLGERVILKDCCVIADETEIAADTVIPPFTRISSSENRDEQHALPYVQELPPSTAIMLQEASTERYQEFVAAQQLGKTTAVG